jgi:hypothetical protein
MTNDAAARFLGPTLSLEKGNTKVKLSNSIKQPSQSFASVLLAFSLFGFLFPHHTHAGNGRHQMNFMQKSRSGKIVTTPGILRHEALGSTTISVRN